MTYRGSSSAAMPKPPISVSPWWQKNCSFNQAKGAKTSARALDSPVAERFEGMDPPGGCLRGSIGHKRRFRFNRLFVDRLLMAGLAVDPLFRHAVLAASAYVIVALDASFQAAQAATRFAHGADSVAVVAAIAVAALAVVPVVFAQAPTALGAVTAVPVHERNVRALVVVSRQHTTHEQTSVSQPAFPEGSLESHRR